MKTTDVRPQDEERDNAVQKELARAKKVNAILMRVLIALTILAGAQELFAPTPQQPSR
jgi:hypothetical protein